MSASASSSAASRKAERDRIVDEKLALVGLDKWADKFTHELSGGMQQRVGLARAFATDADILLMDEPFSALDPLIRDKLQDELLELQQKLQKTIVFVSHDLDEALKIGNRIAIMEAGGRPVGAPEEIVLNPANDYVRQFVASMNPLNVLKGGTLMRPLSDLAREPGGGALLLDRAGKCRCRLDGRGKPIDLMVNGKPGEFVPYATDLNLLEAAGQRHDLRHRAHADARRGHGALADQAADGAARRGRRADRRGRRARDLSRHAAPDRICPGGRRQADVSDCSRPCA